MTKEEFAQIVVVLKTAYPKNEMLETTAQKNVWYESLKDIDGAMGKMAAQRLICKSKWFPTIAEIREEALSVMLPQKDWGEAWQEVIAAVSKYGMYQEIEALGSFDDITRQCVKRLGWKQICWSTNIQNERANFRMIFEELEKKQAAEFQVPANMRLMMQERGLIE